MKRFCIIFDSSQITSSALSSRVVVALVMLFGGTTQASTGELGMPMATAFCFVQGDETAGTPLGRLNGANPTAPRFFDSTPEPSRQCIHNERAVAPEICKDLLSRDADRPPHREESRRLRESHAQSLRRLPEL